MKLQYLLALPLMAVACTASDAQESHPMEQPRTISVTGHGSAAGSPDMAMLTFAVVTEGKTASAAIQANAEAMTNVRNTLRGLNIEARDMQTSNFSLNPQYAQDDRGRIDRYNIIGYTANNSLGVRLRDVSNVGEAIDKAVRSGANNLNGLSFGFQNTEELMEQARRKAVRNARAIADLMAEEAGVEIGTVITMSENAYRPEPRPMMRMSMDSAEAASTPIEGGESALEVTVNVTYSLK